ncbi:MAG: archease [Methanomicrobiales archaeon]|nr:archease [Methanomicrobiales archaeon]
MSFVELSHTADVKIQVRAPTLSLLFSDAFCALMQTAFGTDRRAEMSREIQVTATDTETLLLDFLSEVLFICEVDGLVFARANIQTDGKSLTAVLEGEAFDRSRHAGGTEVKGISWSGLSLARSDNEYVLEILFDV